LILICILAAFATNDWDIRSTILAEDPQKTVERILPFDPDSEEEFLEVVGSKLSDDESLLLFEIMVHSPLSVPMKIEVLSFELNFGGNTSILSLQDEVEIPANGSASLTLECPIPNLGGSSASGSDVTPTFANMTMRVDIEGIKLEVVKNG